MNWVILRFLYCICLFHSFWLCFHLCWSVHLLNHKFNGWEWPLYNGGSKYIHCRPTNASTDISQLWALVRTEKWGLIFWHLTKKKHNSILGKLPLFLFSLCPVFPLLHTSLHLTEQNTGMWYSLDGVKGGGLTSYAAWERFTDICSSSRTNWDTVDKLTNVKGLRYGCGYHPPTMCRSLQ